MPLFYPLISRSFRRIPKVVRLRCTESDDSPFLRGLAAADARKGGEIRVFTLFSHFFSLPRKEVLSVSKQL